MIYYTPKEKERKKEKRTKQRDRGFLCESWKKKRAGEPKRPSQRRKKRKKKNEEKRRMERIVAVKEEAETWRGILHVRGKLLI